MQIFACETSFSAPVSELQFNNNMITFSELQEGFCSDDFC